MPSVAKMARRREGKRERRKRRQQRKRQFARARDGRRKLEDTVRRAPRLVQPLLQCFAVAFTAATFLRFVLLVLSAILTTGRRTISNLLRTAGELAPGDPSSYHRVLSHRRWSSFHLARALAGWIFHHFIPGGCIRLVGDDTVDEHPGDKVHGKGLHRDAVRSSHTYTAFRWGHKWVVLAVLVQFPFTQRPWALPIFVALYRPAPKDKKGKIRHKTPSQWMRQMLRCLMRWFPNRQFVFAGDGGYGTHELARAAVRSGQRLKLISRFYADAALYEPPPSTRRKGAGRPRVRGKKLASPSEVVAATSQRQKLNVSWYGGGRRDVEVISGKAHWYRAAAGLVAVLWVYVHDCSGTHRDEYFFTTDLEMLPQELIEIFTGRWSIETMFQEMRAYLGLETTRGRKAETVLRAAPCLFGLYTVIALWYSALPAPYARERAVNWVGKRDITFSDAITAVRRYLWQEWIFAMPVHNGLFKKLARPFRRVMLYALAPAA